MLVALHLGLAHSFLVPLWSYSSLETFWQRTKEETLGQVAHIDYSFMVYFKAQKHLLHLFKSLQTKEI